MARQYMVIEDSREDGRWEPIPLYAPTPMPYRPEPVETEQRDGDGGGGGCVIVIDLNDYSETRL